MLFNCRRLSLLAPAALIALLLAGVAQAQILNGTITGTVKDPTDAVVPNASVTVSDSSTNQQYKTVSDESGGFTVPNLPNGFYKVMVEHPGFAKTEVSNVQVFVSQISRVALKLEVAKTGTEVIVEAQAAFVQTESAELKNTIDRRQIMELPLNSRNPMDLVKSFAGIITAGGSGDAFAHGLRGNATNLTQDGINVADNFVKTSAFFAISAPTVDTVGEFNVSVGGIGADAGFGAAQVSIVTQRGTNQFHGSAFWFQRTNELNANTWFNNQAGIARPFQLQQRLGANGGGPVYIPKIYNGKNRTWVFGTYEAYREPLSRGRTRTVLTDTARTGLFSWSSGTGGLQTINLLNIGTIGTSGAKPVVNQDLMGLYSNYVPSTGLTDAGCSNGDGRNIRCFVFNLPGKNITDRYTLRVDHQITSKHSASFVFNQADFDSTPDLLNAIEPQFPKSPTGGQGSRRQVLVWAVQSIFGNNKTNEARAGYQRAPVGFNYPYNFSDFGGVQVNPAGAGLTAPVLTSTNLPQGRNTPVRQAIDNFSWTKGKHSLRFGGEYRQILANNYFYNTVIPAVNLGNNTANPDGLSASSFPGGISASDLTRAQAIFDTITGLLGNTSQGFNHTTATSGFVANAPRVTNPIQHNISGYAQDSWRMMPGLTLQFGTRWEFQGVFDDRTGLVLLPQNATTTLWGPTQVGAFFSTATNGATDSLLTLQGANNGHPYYKRDWNNFAPFVGIAWDPWKNGKTSIRASFATHYTQDGFTFFAPASTANAGLFTTATNSVPTGVYSIKSNPLPTAPADVFPVSQKANFLASNAQSLTNVDPNLVTPYILEWSFGIQRELPKRLSVEVRYAANHAVKQYRAWNVNEVDLNYNGLLPEFINAQNNLNISLANGKGSNFSNQGLAGQVALPIFDKILQGIATASGYGNSGFITNLQQNTVGSMFDTIRRSPTYRTNITNNLPLNFFVANPWANSALQYDNSGWSYYDGLEIEVNRRMAGLTLQATYTFSKVLSDTNFLNSQTESENYISVLNRRLDKFRAGFDATHSLAGNVLYPLPFGRGRRFLGNAHGVANLLIGGWQVTGFTHVASGNPITISSGRVTTGSLLTSTAMIRNMTQRQLQSQLGVFRGPNGVYFINPDSGLIKINGTTSTAVFCTPGQTTPCFDNPAPGQIGNTSYNQFSGPHFFGQDASISKHTKFGPDGRLDFEIRLEMFNVFNTAVFTSPSNSIQSSTFGQLTAVLDTTRAGGVFSRTGQWAVRLSF
jgi:hypothetical protein